MLYSNTFSLYFFETTIKIKLLNTFRILCTNIKIYYLYKNSSFYSWELHVTRFPHFNFSVHVYRYGYALDVSRGFRIGTTCVISYMTGKKRFATFE